MVFVYLRRSFYFYFNSVALSAHLLLPSQYIVISERLVDPSNSILMEGYLPVKILTSHLKT